MTKLLHKLLRILQERVFIVTVVIIGLMIILLFQFYKLQIIDYEQYATGLRASVERTIEIPATRGLIFDRYGRALATNKASSVLKVDQQVKMTEKNTNAQFNRIILEVLTLLEENDDEYIDEVPISQTAPFEYTVSQSLINQFTYSIPYSGESHRLELANYTAEEMMAYLRGPKCFNIDEAYSDEEARKIIAVRAQVYKVAGYRKYNLVTIANNISDKTVAQLEENHMHFPSMIVDVEPIRYYPEGEILGNILGYTRTITAAQYEQMKEDGYDQQDVVGHEGVEKAMESELRGEKGLERVEVDNLGRRVHTIEQDDASSGNNVFLTIDLDLQRAAYESVEKQLSQALIERLKGTNRDIVPVSGHEFVVSMVQNNQLLLSKMALAEETSKQKEIYDILVDAYEKLDELVKQTLSLKDFLVQLLEEDRPIFTDKEILLAMHEQGAIKLSEETVQNIYSNKNGGVESILIDQLEKSHLKPNQSAIDPFSAAAVVIDVNTGETLAIVGYPTFDSNEMITNFNSYYTMLNSGDERDMLWNRALMTIQAPGSTFKMISGIAGLEEGVVTTSTLINDTGIFTKVGDPAPRCWIYSRTGGGHGLLDIYAALEVSCNYYFYEVAYRLGLNGQTSYTGIDTLTKYVEMFGLDQKTGIEIAEAQPNVSTPKSLVQRRMTSVFTALRNMTEERRFEHITSVTKSMQESSQRGLYPYGNSSKADLDSRIEVATQYELKRNLEPLLQQTMEDRLEGIVARTFEDIQVYLQENTQDVIDAIVVGTMQDTSTLSLKNKTKVQANVVLSNMVGEGVTRRITEAIFEINKNDLLDAYDHAYTVIYNRELRRNTDPELIEGLRQRIESIDENAEEYRYYVASKVEENLVSVITDYLINSLAIDWSDGITVRTAIGQGDNAFTPLQMGRYIAGLANTKQVFDLRLVAGVYDNKQTENYIPTEPIVYNELAISNTTMDAIHQGMLDVVSGSRGSARVPFANYPIPVAGKTGTAQGSGLHEHSWFVSFAPYDNPQIAVVTTIYNSDGLGTYGTLIAKDILTEYFRLEKEPERTTLDNMFVE
jgi:penicillin-binding protein 2